MHGTFSYEYLISFWFLLVFRNFCNVLFVYMKRFNMSIHTCFGFYCFSTYFAIAAPLEEGEETRIPGGL